MSYNYAGQPPYQSGYNPNMGNNPYQQAPSGPGWNVNNPQQGGYVPPPPVVPRMMNDTYVESGNVPKDNLSFSDQTIRAAFVRKVFTLVAIMLGVVAVMSAMPFIHHPIKSFVHQNMALYWVSYGVFLGVYIALMCCESVRRSFPSNLIMTAILTLAIGYMTMMLCSVYDIVSVLLTLIITTVCCASIIVFAATTKKDLTSMLGVMFILSMVLFLFGLVAVMSVYIFKVKFLYTIYAGLAALLFMFYLAIDIQMIMGGRKYEISPEDHIFAAIQIFLDIIYIFWMLLSLIGGASNN
uniref:Protein lifeguard 1-like n=1 Tax=Steinernema glaseri TaxID=37863 RepID=A0A1I7ZQZ0_9BILA